ncbi:MAG TPA: DNA-directed RNA polymerase subunit beta [bacterium]|nr:DNA-directed RNA polymerase subunit beta [bacterium]HNS33956.1 DNA-directed RNA polymerase subunit beta [bacterium]HPN81296.1 DNA-directed RNA polymerase subunit beta [bacterium]HPW39417.1 DNA-directed RNA polymerase subunit beta [bacterium]HQA63520.1 DNA-directed RNA polymerase subunit beta [bacterium]
MSQNNKKNNLVNFGDRKSFSNIGQMVDLPDLIELQKKAYQWFWQEGLKELFEEISPIVDFIGRDLELSFGEFFLDEPKFDEVTSREKNITYEAPLRVSVKLVNKKTSQEIEQEIYLGDFPVMTDRGTFVINGIERVVVSQLIRSAGVFFTSQPGIGRDLYGAKVIPNRGSWLEFETDNNNVIWVKIDRKRKVAATALLRAFGYSNNDEIRELFRDIDTDPNRKYIEATINKDVSKNEAEGLIEVYKRIRPGDLATPDNAKQLIDNMFFNFSRYDFDRVGRYKLNQRFGQDLPINKETRVLLKEDIVNILRKIIKYNNSQEEADDIDHLGNRRIRAVGELVQNKFRIGLARMERIIKDRMSTLDITNLTPGKLINARPVISAVKEFFMSSQLSQFMDQVNPLAELEHKRRLSAMGPGGLSRDRAGFEVRDVHQTHYGRICPIATPEGPNIGLVGHLSSFAKVNDYGFIETPYYKVVKEGNRARVTSEIVYLDAFEESQMTTTPFTTRIDEQGYFIDEKIGARVKLNPTIINVENVDYMDVAPNQIVSVATSLIPFLEHDDAVRALMGTNMQRQAVSCINPEAPLVGTGVERKAAYNSGHLIIAREGGEVIGLSGDKIEVLNKDKKIDVYRLNKFVRSNNSTCINQTPIVKKGQQVKSGEVLADGPATDRGELALGKNILVAFMPWQGYNYEDAIIVSERLIQQDRYSSIHIENYVCEVRETKLGPEVVTSDIPNVSEEKLKDLDEEGIVRIGANVRSGDILVGKITPKGETELSAEEKLLRAIFGEKARDVRDSSLYLEHGSSGKVIDIKIFSRENGDKLSSGMIKMIQVTVASLRKIQIGDKMAGRHGNKGVISRVVPVEDLPHLADGRPVDIILSPLGVVSRMNLGQVLETHLGLAAKTLGYKAVTPVFNGINEEIIRDQLAEAGFNRDGRIQLYDGRSGEPFDKQSTVGYIYMLKLNHLVEDKIHQRSIGPYSLITQQPLGGKAQFGGQRFGEMEVWALEAYGAAHTLQEVLTIKSDDVVGRSKTYESIIKGEPINNLNIPESFNVLVRELKGLSLNVELLDENGQLVDNSIGEEKIKED